MAYLRYVAECFWQSLHVWEKAQRVGALITFLIAIPVGVLAANGWRVTFDSGLVQTLSSIGGAWFVCLFLFVTPYKLYKEQRNVVTEIEKRAAYLQIGVHGISETIWRDGMQLYVSRLAVYNSSFTMPLSNVAVRIEKITDIDTGESLGTELPATLMIAGGQSELFNLQLRMFQLIPISGYKVARDGKIHIGPLKGRDDIVVPYGYYRIDVAAYCHETLPANISIAIYQDYAQGMLTVIPDVSAGPTIMIAPPPKDKRHMTP